MAAAGQAVAGEQFGHRLKELSGAAAVRQLLLAKALDERHDALGQQPALGGGDPFH